MGSGRRQAGSAAEAGEGCATSFPQLERAVHGDQRQCDCRWNKCHNVRLRRITLILTVKIELMDIFLGGIGMEVVIVSTTTNIAIHR